MSVNVNLTGQNVIQINGGIMINVNVSVKKIIYVKKIMFGILLHVTVKTENIKQALWRFNDYVLRSHKAIWWRNENYFSKFSIKKLVKNKVSISYLPFC